MLLNKEFAAAGVQRSSVHLTNAILCQPPGNNMKALADQIRGQNAAIAKSNREVRKRFKKRGEDPNSRSGGRQQQAVFHMKPFIRSPQDCCRPRLARELAHFRRIIPLGGIALKTILGGKPSLMKLRGSLLDGDLLYDETENRLMLSDAGGGAHPVRLLATFHPSYVMKFLKWSEVFRGDLDRMVRWQRGKIRWSEPKVTYNPRAEQLREFLFRGPPVTYDVETDGIEALSCNVRCVGLGNGEEVMNVGVRTIASYGQDSIDGPPFYSLAEMAAVKDVLREFFEAPVWKAGHNAGYYDRMVIRNWLGVDPKPTMDTIMLHRLVKAELPHSLGFVGSTYTDVPAWKADKEGRKLATDAETDHELHTYCAYDVAVTARVLTPLITEVHTQDLGGLVSIDHKVQRICADMHTVGMFVDQEVRAKYEKKALREMLTERSVLKEIAGNSSFNPGSTQQLAGVLFKQWGLEPDIDDKIRYTATGAAKTDDQVLRALLSTKLTKQQRAFIGHLRRYRGLMKQLGTYIVKLRPMHQTLSSIGWDDDETREEREERIARGYDKKGIVWPDGRMRAGYNAHVPVTGRKSSSAPINADNFPKWLRAMIVAQPGHKLVGVDSDQLELRIAAARWKLKGYVEALDNGWDPHTSVTAHAVFGKAFEKAAGSPFPWMNGTKFDGDAHLMRQLSKIIQYAFQYWAGVETGHRIITSTELEDGSFPYLHLSVKDVRQMRKQWLAGVPELQKGWDAEMDHYRRHKWVAEPVHGRKRFFLDGENKNEIVNFPIQSAAAALINNAMIKVWEEIPLHRWGPGTGLLTQTHDSLVVECPEDQVGYVKEVLESAMNVEHPGLPGVRFTGTADVGHTWKEVG
jgi:DNA polymerase I-like protein with 3'-5' exonuclease and polymerase domains